MDTSPVVYSNKRDTVNWITCIAVVSFHVLAVVALFNATWGAVAVAFALHWICIGWGIGLGYHRLHTHRSYKTSTFVEYFFAVCGTLTLEGGPIFWTATHRIHHQHSNTEVMGKYAPDLMKKRFYRVLNRWHWVPLVVLGLVLLAIGGWPWALWGIFLRVVVGLHCTWLVNSATHLWGSRRFETSDDSKNSWWVALITFGEGWHNNHHAYPTSARHGMTWKEVDLSWIQIRIMTWLGLAWDIKAPTASQIAGRSITLERAA